MNPDYPPMQASKVPESRVLADRLEQTMSESISYWRGQCERAIEQRDATRDELEGLKKHLAHMTKLADEQGNPDRESARSTFGDKH